MNDIKDILNKLKFVPEELQDTILENIKVKIEEEIIKGCNPIDLVVTKLKELEFGNTDFGNDTDMDRRIIRIIISCMPTDWFWMKPLYCESVEKETNAGHKYYVNKTLFNFLETMIEEDDPDATACEFIDIANQCHKNNIDIKKDSLWLWRDGANGELWINTTTSLAQEMLYWFEDCMFKKDEEDIECAYRVLKKLEKSFPKKD